MVRSPLHGFLFATLVVAFASFGSNLFAGNGPGFNAVPEISPTTASSAIAILSASGLMLAERLRLRRK